VDILGDDVGDVGNALRIQHSEIPLDGDDLAELHRDRMFVDERFALRERLAGAADVGRQDRRARRQGDEPEGAAERLELAVVAARPFRIEDERVAVAQDLRRQRDRLRDVPALPVERDRT
jgi:hypothetical protein